MNRSKNPLNINYIISFIIKFSAIILFGFGLTGLIIIFLLNRNLGPGYKEGIYALSRLKNSLPYTIFIITIIQTLTLCIITLLFTLIWSHSIAGPIIRFKKYLKEISSGKLLTDKVTFRNSDQLQDLAKEFSEMILSEKNNSTNALALLVEAQKLLDECAAFSKDLEQLDLKLKKLKTVYLQIKDIYKLNAP